MANEVRVDAESTTRNYINENRVVQTKVTGMVKNAEITEVKQFDDGSYQLMMRMPMIGANGLGQALLPVEMERVRKVKVVCTTKRNDIISKSEISPCPPIQMEICRKWKRQKIIQDSLLLLRG